MKYDTKKLESFFEAVSRLTCHHDVIHDHACVTAHKLGMALSEVNPEWWRNISPMTKKEIKEHINVGNGEWSDNQFGCIGDRSSL